MAKFTNFGMKNEINAAVILTTVSLMNALVSANHPVYHGKRMVTHSREYAIGVIGARDTYKDNWGDEQTCDVCVDPRKLFTMLYDLSGHAVDDDVISVSADTNLIAPRLLSLVLRMEEEVHRRIEMRDQKPDYVYPDHVIAQFHMQLPGDDEPIQGFVEYGAVLPVNIRMLGGNKHARCVTVVFCHMHEIDDVLTRLNAGHINIAETEDSPSETS